VQEQILAAMEKADLPPELAYAYRKTGLLGLGRDKSAWPPEHVTEWNAAVDEYRAQTAAAARKHESQPESTASDDEVQLARLNMSVEDAHRWRHSEKLPGFVGELESCAPSVAPERLALHQAGA
jgi:hypothetical protein